MLHRIHALIAALLMLGLGAFSCDGSLFDNGGRLGREPHQAKSMSCMPSDPNAQVFERALCLCGDLDNVGTAVVAGSFSSAGDNAETVALGHVGINGSVGAVGDLYVDGDLAVGAAVDGVGFMQVSRSATIGTDFDFVSEIEIGQDLMVGGDLSGVGSLAVAGETRVGGELAVLGELQCDDVAQGQSLSLAPPCDCDAGALLDVAALVAAQREAQPLDLPQSVGEHSVTLSAGDYYSADGAELVGEVRYRIEGAVRIFVEADLALVGSGVFELAEGAELDLYVAGSIDHVGDLELGAGDAAPLAFRLYIGGSRTVHLDAVGSTIVRGNIYAPRADIAWVGELLVEGSLFAHQLDGVGELSVYFDTAMIGLGEGCVDEFAEVVEDDGDAEPPASGECELENGCYQ